MAVAGEMDDIGVLLHDGDDIAARSLAIVAVPFGRGIRSALDLMMREQNDRRITVCEVVERIAEEVVIGRVTVVARANGAHGDDRNAVDVDNLIGLLSGL